MSDEKLEFLETIAPKVAEINKLISGIYKAANENLGKEIEVRLIEETGESGKTHSIRLYFIDI